MHWQDHWRQQARRTLRAELSRYGITYKELVRRLCDAGGSETESSVTQKLSRGKFQFAFFLQCMWVIGARSLPLELVGPGSRPPEKQKRSAADEVGAAKWQLDAKKVLREVAKSRHKGRKVP